jgi:N-methylhydantoinase A
MAWRLGVDIGGTFTDFVLVNTATGQIILNKVPSSPDNPATAVITGLRQLHERHGISAQNIEYLGHGSTVATNTLIERTGAVAGLLVTEGFGDILSIARLGMPDTSDLQGERPVPLVPRKLVKTVSERLLANGQVHKSLDVESMMASVTELLQQGVEAIAICFHHSYQFPEHEALAKKAIRAAFPEVPVCTSSEIWPEIREYERTLVTTINAYVGPKVSRYYRSLSQQTASLGLGGRFLVTRGNGGLMDIAAAVDTPIFTLGSGPASGVAAASYVAKVAGFEKLIALDIGGTSTDVAIVDGELPYATETPVGDFPIMIPLVDVSSIGAGGGSIASIDRAGILKVGPHSAGAMPGPACYGQGGQSATLTDAYVGAGMIDPEQFLGGRIKIQPERALHALRSIGEKIGRSPEQTADGIIEVVTAKMYAELVRLIAKKGIDVSEFSLMVYGGAGPTHGFLLAKELGIRRVIVPATPGLLCALGCLTTDVKSDFIRTVNVVLSPGKSTAELGIAQSTFRELGAQGTAWLRKQQVRPEHSVLQRSADMHYLGQSYEITVPLEDEDINDGRVENLLRAFHEHHNKIYGHSDNRASVELINARVTAVGRTRKPTAEELAYAWKHTMAEPAGPPKKREILLQGQSWQATIYERKRLRPGQEIIGPAIVEQYDSTSCIPEGFTCYVDRFGNVIGELRA